MKQYTLGIDLHKRTCAWVVIDSERNLIWETEVSAHPSHISTALNRLSLPPEDIQVALEPVTGWRWVSDLLEQHGLEVHIAHPEDMQLIARSRQKTDRNDARTLAELLRSGYFPEARKVSAQCYRLRTITRSRSFLVGLRTDTKNRLHGMATTRGLHTIPGGNPLHKRGKEALTKESEPAYHALYHTLESLDTRIDELEEVLKRETHDDPVVRLLLTAPGIGAVTAATIRAEVGEFTDFPSGDKLASFAGLVPRQRSSGENVRHGSITNTGSAYLRTAMVEAAMRITQKNAPHLYAFYERLERSCGAKRARIALARKLLTIVWSMAVHNQPYRSPSPAHHAHEQSRFVSDV